MNRSCHIYICYAKIFTIPTFSQFLYDCILHTSELFGLVSTCPLGLPTWECFTSENKQLVVRKSLAIKRLFEHCNNLFSFDPSGFWMNYKRSFFPTQELYWFKTWCHQQRKQNRSHITRHVLSSIVELRLLYSRCQTRPFYKTTVYHFK